MLTWSCLVFQTLICSNFSFCSSAFVCIKWICSWRSLIFTVYSLLTCRTTSTSQSWSLSLLPSSPIHSSLLATTLFNSSIWSSVCRSLSTISFLRWQYWSLTFWISSKYCWFFVWLISSTCRKNSTSFLFSAWLREIVATSCTFSCCNWLMMNWAALTHCLAVPSSFSSFRTSLFEAALSCNKTLLLLKALPCMYFKLSFSSRCFSLSIMILLLWLSYILITGCSRILSHEEGTNLCSTMIFALPSTFSWGLQNLHLKTSLLWRHWVLESSRLSIFDLKWQLISPFADIFLSAISKVFHHCLLYWISIQIYAIFTKLGNKNRSETIET